MAKVRPLDDKSNTVKKLGVFIPKYSYEQYKAIIESGEPVFVLRAQDFFALKTLHSYISYAEDHCSYSYIHNLFTLLIAFSKWKIDNYNEMKIPD